MQIVIDFPMLKSLLAWKRVEILDSCCVHVVIQKHFTATQFFRFSKCHLLRKTRH